MVIANPSLNSFSIQSGATTLAPGAYAVVVSNYAAFDVRYHVAANHIPVVGVFSGNLSNGGEFVRLFQSGAAESGVIPAYDIDRVNYSDHAPWPAQPNGSGPALGRIHAAEYGNDPINWTPTNALGTPGIANTPLDTSAPTVPANLAGRATINPNQIALSWSV